jgi:hypothetical protein
MAELEKWLAQQGLGKYAISEEAIRLDLQYMGPGNGCAVQISVLESALRDARAAAGLPPPADG